MLMSDAPSFTVPPPQGSEGVDFLGTRAVNLSLMALAIPGINNVVSWIRPFSLIAWMVWRFEEGVRRGQTQPGAADFECFSEKIESLFVWSHQISGVTQGVPGMRQNQPQADLAHLSFAAFGQRTDATSLFAAVNYGPASKAPFGLGFITGVSPGLYAVTPSGLALAEALDAHLRERLTPELYAVLSNFQVTTASAAQAQGLFPAWYYAEPTAAEREVFSARLFQPQLFDANAHEAQPGAPQRTAFIAFVRSSLAEHEHALTLEELRKRLCTRPGPQKESDRVPAQALVEARAVWQVLQVRQAQRLGLEALFAWSESVIWRGEARSSIEIAQTMLESVKGLGVKAEAAVPFPLDPSTDADQLFERALAYFESRAHDVDTLYASMEQDDAFNMFKAMDELIQSSDGPLKAQDACARALVLLALAAVFARHFVASPLHAQYASQGATFRIPLQVWSAFAQANRSSSLIRFLTRLLETFVVSQHFAIAASRFADEKSRLRFTIDDAGLTSLLGKPSDVLSPAASPDRLATLLALCADAELVSSKPDHGKLVYWCDGD